MLNCSSFSWLFQFTCSTHAAAEFNSFFCRQVATNLVTLQTCLTSMMGRPITMDQLRQDVGNMVEKITKVITSFRDFRLSMQEYVCLKVVAMLTQDGECSRNNH